MKKIFLTMGMACVAASTLAQGYVLLGNASTSSGHWNLYSLSGPPAPLGNTSAQLLWYNGTNFQTVGSPVLITAQNGGTFEPDGGMFFVDVTPIVIPVYSATGTFIVQGWTGNYADYASAVAAGIASGTNALVGQTAPFICTEGTSSNIPRSICPSGESVPPGWWDGNLALTPVPVPAVSNGPASLSASAGSNVTLSVTASGLTPLSYQWQFNGSNVPGATNSALNFPSVQLTNAGYYDVIITNALGSVTSSVAALSVGPAGAPSVYLNSNLVAITASAVGSAAIELTDGFPDGFIFYTLDGSAPTGASTLYEGPFTLTNPAIINALGYSSDFSESAAMQPLALVIYAVNTSVSGSGSVSLSQNTNVSGGNSMVTLTATPATNWAFAQWEGDVSSTNNPLTVTVSSNLNVEAVFVPSAYLLTLATPGGGTVLANGQAITSGYYATNSTVTLSASPNSGWTFEGWGGGITGNANPYYLDINGPYHVSGVFGTVLATNAAGGGQIVLSTANQFNYGDSVTATAVPNNGNYFVVWSGVASGINSPVTAVVTNTTLSALFEPLPQNKLALSVVVLGSGSVSINPQQSYYNYGDTVTLTATSNNPSIYFNGWSGGDNDTTTNTVVTMTTNLVVYANFNTIPRPNLEIAFASGGAIIQASGLMGLGAVMIYSSPDLTNWQPIYTNPPVIGSFRFVDTNALSAPVQYYRAVVQ